MTDTAKLFTHGRSQAVRLPKAFRFEGTEVRIVKVGNAVILQPMRTDDAMPWNLIDQTGDSPFMQEGRDQPSMPVDRVQFS
jgi:antitoxin VapB